MAEMLERDPGALVTFTFELASCRLFMDRLDASPRDVADAIERDQRGWLRSLVALLPHPSRRKPLL